MLLHFVNQLIVNKNGGFMKDTICIQVSQLSKTFSEQEVLTNCCFSIKCGEIYGILGVNGAGKTTLLKLLAGLLEPTEGSISILGKEMHQNREKILKEIGSLIEVPHFYEHLSAAENLDIHLAYMQPEEQLEITEALSIVGLENVSQKPVSKFSLGMRQRLGIARAIIHKPKVLLLDEPINGLDPVAIRTMRELFLKLASSGITLLISSHILSEMEETVTRMAILSKGHFSEEGSIEDLKQTYAQGLENYFIHRMSDAIS